MSQDKFTKTRDIIKNFGDPKAVVREWKDANGDTIKIEVFYGGKDGGDSAGHGHFVAEKIDDLFQTVLDRHPDSADGGRHEIEYSPKSDRDPYNDEARLDRIRGKQEIIKQISYLNYEDSQCIGKIKELEAKFHNIGSCGHADNISLRSQLKEAKDLFFSNRRLYLEQKFSLTWSKKEALINQAHTLLYASNSFEAREEMKRLFDEWKELPRTTREKDDDLWNRFNAVRTEFREKQQREYEARKAQQMNAKIKKEAIVGRAETLAQSTDFKAAKNEMQSLFEQWKTAPHASKQDEDILWRRFQHARDTLFSRAKQDYEKRQLEYADAKAKKEAIISQAQALCGTSDFRSASDRMRDLSQQFYNAGSAGKNNQALKEQFNQIKAQFYAAKRVAGELRHKEYLQKLQNRLFEKQQSLSRLEDAISRTQSSISDLLSKSPPSYTNPHRYEIADRRNAKLSNLNEKLRSMSERKIQLVSQIVELQSKLRE